MYAITSKGIGKKVGARSILPDWDLAEGETFTVEEFNEDLVLAEDGVSLREPTAEELEPSYQEKRAVEYPTIQEQLDMQYWDSVNGTTVWKDMVTSVKAKYPKGAE
jgi:hypothetical protein